MGEKVAENAKGLEMHSDPVEWLRLEYLRRRERNPQYSLRAFARQLRLSVGSVSEILSRKRGLTPKLADRIANSLALSPSERGRLLILTARVKQRQASDTSFAIAEALPFYPEVPSDSFNLIADWYHYAILALMETADFQSNPQWIARRLGITVTEVRSALDRLLRLGMVREGSQGLESSGYFSSSTDVPSAALRKFHAQLLDRARSALEEVAIDRRDITSITMAVDVSRLPEMKKLIRQFRRRVASFLDSGNRTEVYHLNIQLIPATGK